MTIEKPKALLDAGSITQEEFDQMAQAIGETDPEPTADPAPEPDPEPTPEPDEAAKRRYQAQLDREMAKERKEKAELKRKLERLENKILTEEEKKQREFEEQQRELEEQRKELILEKNKMYAVKSMKKANISDSEEAMLLMERLVASCVDEADIDDAIELLKAWKEKDVAAEVDKRFKSAGYTPKQGSNTNGGKNPWAKGQENFTEQMRIEATDPDTAAKLKAAAGVI